MINKNLITPGNKRAAIVSKLFKAVALITWAATNYILYIKFKQCYTKKIKLMEEILKLNASNEQLIRILASMHDRITDLETQKDREWI